MNRKEQFKNGPKRPTNPAHRFIEWKAGPGHFSYFDKEAGREVKIDFPYSGVLLAERHAVRGFSDRYGARISSTEVGDLRTEPLKVFTFKYGQIITLAEGLWADIKERVKYLGGKYARILYVKPEGANSMDHFSLTGAALNWLDFRANHYIDMADHYLAATGSVQDKKGAVIFHRPKWALGPQIKKEDDMQAEALYQDLQRYFSEYSRSVIDEITKPDQDEDKDRPGEAFRDMVARNLRPEDLEKDNDLPF